MVDHVLASAADAESKGEDGMCPDNYTSNKVVNCNLD